MATHASNLLLKDLVVESCLEFTLSRGCGCDIHGSLTTTENNKVFFGRDCGAVQGGVCGVGLENLEVAGGDELGGLILAGGDEVGAVGRPLEIGHLAAEFMGRNAVDDVAGLAVELRNGTVLVAGDDVLGHVAPTSDGGLALVADDAQDLLGVLFGGGVDVDVEHNDGTQVTHTLLGDAQQLGAVLVELDTLDGGREVPGHQALSARNLPQLNGVVGGAGCDDCAGGVDVDGPDGTLVAVVCAEALAIVGEPGADVLILGCGEDDVAIAVISRCRRGADGKPKSVTARCDWTRCKWVVSEGGRRDKTYLICVRARSWPARRMGLMLG